MNENIRVCHVITYDAYRIKYKHIKMSQGHTVVNEVIMKSYGFNLSSLLRVTKNILHTSQIYTRHKPQLILELIIYFLLCIM